MGKDGFSQALRNALDVADDMLDVLNETLANTINFHLHGVELAYDEELGKNVQLVTIKVVDNRKGH